MRPAAEGFRRAERLRKSLDFQLVARHGRRFASGVFVVLATARPAGAAGGVPSRLGLTVSRKVGNAVVRNRVKRLVREWFRRGRGLRRSGLDVVVVARSPAARLGLDGVSAELDRLCAGLLESRA